MDPRVAPLAETLRINTRLFGNCLNTLTEEQARACPSECTNSAAYVAAHMVESRFYILKMLGDKQESPLADRIGWRALSAITEWPTLDEIRSAWATASKGLDRRLAGMAAAELDTPSDSKLPLESRTTLGVLVFLVQHDSYHLGQLSLLRKFAGLPAMSYS